MQPRVHLKLTLFRSGTHNTRPLRRGPRPVSLPSTIPADLTRNHGMMLTQTPTNDPKRFLSSQSHHYLVTIVIGQLLNNRHPPNPPFGTLPRSYPLALRPVDIKVPWVVPGWGADHPRTGLGPTRSRRVGDPARQRRSARRESDARARIERCRQDHQRVAAHRAWAPVAGQRPGLPAPHNPSTAALAGSRGARPRSAARLRPARRRARPTGRRT